MTSEKTPGKAAQHWNQRYLQENTPWDIGAPSPPLINFATKYISKEARILIPGAGNAYEAEALHRLGYPEVFVCDWAPEPIQRFARRVPSFPRSHLIVQDFFSLRGRYDFILEQTFLSALSPSSRPEYARQCHSLLTPDGVMAGVLFKIQFPFEGPPFGGSIEEYEALFSPLFHIIKLETARDSIRPRAGSECFIHMVAK